jgi:hypothetical protein
MAIQPRRWPSMPATSVNHMPRAMAEDWNGCHASHRAATVLRMRHLRVTHPELVLARRRLREFDGRRLAVNDLPDEPDIDLLPLRNLLDAAIPAAAGAHPRPASGSSATP